MKAPELSVQKLCTSTVEKGIREWKSTIARGPERKLGNLHFHLMPLLILKEFAPVLSGLDVYKMQYSEAVYPIHLH